MKETKIIQGEKEIVYKHSTGEIIYKDADMEHLYTLLPTTNWGVNQVTNFMLRVINK